MRVKVDSDCRVYWNYMVQDLKKDQVVDGDLAVHLATTDAPVTELVDEPEIVADPAGTDTPVTELVADPEIEPDPNGTDAPVTELVDEPEIVADPNGTIKQVLAWVGDDKERAVEALAAEQAKGDKARATLVDTLNKLAEPAGN